MTNQMFMPNKGLLRRFPARFFSIVILTFTLPQLVRAENLSESRPAQSHYAQVRLSLQLCAATKSDRIAKFRATLLRARAPASIICPKVQCDGLSLMQVAKKHQAVRVINYLNYRVESNEFWTKFKALAYA